MAGKNGMMRKFAGAAMVVVTAVTVFMVKDFLDQANAAVQGQVQQNTQLMYDVTAQSGKTGSGTGQGNDLPTLTEADYAAAQAFAEKHSGEWNVEKYFNGEKWKTYELGKRMAITAYNFLNDVEYSTGGYNQLTGIEVIKKVTYIDNRTGLLMEQKVTGNAAVEAIKKKGEVLDTQTVGEIPQYEYVPKTSHKLLPGEDIEYSTPSITVSAQGIDMSGMGGRIFYLDEFRVETIQKNGQLQEYLINDKCDFAITYNGKFLEYCELTISGQYQGYYAFQ